MRKFETVRAGFKQRVHFGELTVGMVRPAHNALGEAKGSRQ